MTNYIQSPLPHSSRVQKELDCTKLLSKALFSLDHASQNTGCEKQHRVQLMLQSITLVNEQTISELSSTKQIMY